MVQGWRAYLNDSAGAVGDSQGGRGSNNVLVVVELESGRLRAVRDVLVNDTSGRGDGGAVLGGDEASGGGDEESGAGEHLD